MKKILFFLLLSIFFSCSKKNDSTPSSLQAPIIHGYVSRDIVGNTIGDIGYPDIKLGDANNFLFNQNNNFFIYTYPNPSNGYAHVYVMVLKPVSKARLWMVKAVYNSTSAQSSAMGGNQFVSGGLPVFELDYTPKYTEESIAIDEKNILPGYYRLYFQTDSVLLWDNIVVSK